MSDKAIVPSRDGPADVSRKHDKSLLENMPPELLMIVLHFLHQRDLVLMRGVNKHFFEFLSSYMNKRNLKLKVSIPLSIVGRSKGMLEYTNMRYRLYLSPWNEWKINLAKVAAQHGSIDGLMYLRGIDKYGNYIDGAPQCPWGPLVAEAAAKAGQLATLKWMRGFNSDDTRWTTSQSDMCHWDSRTTAAAARTGNLQMLQWARSLNPDGTWGTPGHTPCPWDTTTTAAAAEANDLQILMWIRGYDSEGNQQTMNHLKPHVHYRYDPGITEPLCPWDSAVTTIAARNNNADLFLWAVNHGCPVDIDSVQHTTNPRIRAWLDAQPNL